MSRQQAIAPTNLSFSTRSDTR